LISRTVGKAFVGFDAGLLATASLTLSKTATGCS
jgi:hypothetical protein